MELRSILPLGHTDSTTLITATGFPKNYMHLVLANVSLGEGGQPEYPEKTP